MHRLWTCWPFLQGSVRIIRPMSSEVLLPVQRHVNSTGITQTHQQNVQQLHYMPSRCTHIYMQVADVLSTSSLIHAIHLDSN